MSADFPILAVTNPVWLSLFRRGVEDPDWGKHPMNQHATAMAIHGLAETIDNAELRTRIQRDALTLMEITLVKIAQETTDGTASGEA